METFEIALIVLGALLRDGNRVAIDRLGLHRFEPDFRILVGRPVLLEGETQPGIMLQPEADEVLDTGIGQERRRHREELGLARCEDRLRLLGA